MSEIDALLKEERRFAPPDALQQRANIADPAIYDKADADPEAFWSGFARELEWMQPWTEVLRWKSPHAQWFVGGKLNASVNCVDRHARTARRNKAALIWEGEPGDRRTRNGLSAGRSMRASTVSIATSGLHAGIKPP